MKKTTILGNDVERIIQSAKTRVLAERTEGKEVELSALALFEEILLDERGRALLKKAGFDAEKVSKVLPIKQHKISARPDVAQCVRLDKKLHWVFNSAVPKISSEKNVRGRRIRKVELEEVIACLLECGDARIDEIVARAGMTPEKAQEAAMVLRAMAVSRRHSGGRQSAQPGLESYTAYLWERARTFQMRRRAAEMRLGPFSYAYDFILGDYQLKDPTYMEHILRAEAELERKRQASPWWETCPLNMMFEQFGLAGLQRDVLECLLAHDLFGVTPTLQDPLTVRDICKILSPWGYPRNRRAVESSIKSLEETGLIAVEPFSDVPSAMPISNGWVYLPDETLAELIPHGESLPLERADEEILRRQLNIGETYPPEEAEEH